MPTTLPSTYRQQQEDDDEDDDDEVFSSELAEFDESYTGPANFRFYKTTKSVCVFLAADVNQFSHYWEV